MASKRSSVQTVMGHQIAPPRLTVWFWIRLIQYFLIPVFGALVLLDVAFYLLFRYGFDRCYGILCFLE